MILNQMLFIFDLDQTLVDSKIALTLRTQRRWNEVYQKIPQMVIYPYIKQTLDFLKSRDHKIALVTTSPRPYVNRINSYFNLGINNIVAFHDVIKQKPNAEPIIKAMLNAGSSKFDSISFGDREIDIISSKSAGVPSCACMWDTSESEKLINSGASYHFYTTQEMYQFIKLNF